MRRLDLGISLTEKEREVVKAFAGLYGGNHTQRLRDEGNANAMPPWAETFWLGKQVAKCPLDLWVYQEILVETRPELLIEMGSGLGGSAFFFATIMDLVGVGRVVTVDKDSYPNSPQHPRVTYLVGDSVSDQIVQTVQGLAQGQRTMVVLDSLHTYAHVKKELDSYGPLVSSGCYLVCEDTGFGTPDEDWASRSVAEFTIENPNFVADLSREKHLLTSNQKGWLRRQS